MLPLKVDAVGLERFATAVSTPGSPLYGRYLSVAELARRFGASAATRARVVGYLSASGAHSVKVDATGMLAEATVSARLAERLFSSSLARFRAADDTHFIAPVTATTMPAPLRGLVEGVVGLDTEPQTGPPRPSLAANPEPSHVTSPAAGAQTPSALPRSGMPTGCPDGVAAQDDNNPGFTPNQYETAYDFGPLYLAGLSGQGQRVALIEIDGYKLSDLTSFAQCFGLRVPAVSAHAVGVSRLLSPGEEATLDLEVLDAAAPGLQAIDVYETKSDAAHTLEAFAAPLQNPARKPQVISASLGLCEPDAYVGSGRVGIEASERVLEMAAGAGVSFLASSGDDGSSDCETADGTPIDTLAVNYPASSWWVTGVGGTNLELNAANQIAGEDVWNDSSLVPAGGGGGLSALFKRPSYQNGVVRANARAVPDVSMLADLLPGYSIYCTASPECLGEGNTNPWQTVGGTSAGTPLLAGGVAIVDQMLRAAQHENLGLLNPLLYKLGDSSSAATVFYDVMAGGNDIGPYIPGGTGLLLGCCTAKPGYDEASGWGGVAIAGFATQALELVPKIVEFSLALPRRQRPVAHRELLATVSCSAACSIGAFADVRIGRSKPFVVASRLLHRQSQGRKTIPIKFSARQLRTLRAALAHNKKISATVFGALVDSLGAIQQQTAGRTLRISS